ncbi:hypothetical protein J3R83DRAFT_4041 [Lanmaoa asiatica]|nr:hypothetical protein J3R83DRAFT_4041 [Lanmaoa asiatica]
MYANNNHASGISRYSFSFRVSTGLFTTRVPTDYNTPQGYVPNPTYGTVPGHAPNPTYAPTPGYATVPAPPVPVAVAVPTPTHTPTPIVPVLNPVQVPPSCYPIELAQFWRGEYKRGQPFPLHWALFVRTAPPSVSPSSSSGPHGSAHARQRRAATTTTTTPTVPRGNFYELVGTPDTYTAQFLPSVTFEPEMLADWRGTHVIGWVSPGQLHVFERVVKQVPVWRHRPDWWSQQWVYEVVRAVGVSYQGVLMDGVSFGGLQRHMGRLLEAWENGDI